MAYFCTSRPGPSVHLIRYSTEGIRGEWYIPFFDDSQFSSTQKLRTPIKEFFDQIKDAMGNVDLGSTTANAVLQSGLTLTDLFGIKLFSKGLYRQAWAGAEPTPFSITVKFYRGMKGFTGALDEVWIPMIAILFETVPDTGKTNSPIAIMTSPVPSPLDAFTAFARDIGNQATTTATQAANTGTAVVGVLQPLQQQVLSAVTTRLTNPTPTGNNRTWTVDFGWFDGDKTFERVFRIPEAVVESTSWSFSSMVERDAGASYPVSGSITLNMKTQTIYTSSDIVK